VTVPHFHCAVARLTEGNLPHIAAGDSSPSHSGPKRH